MGFTRNLYSYFCLRNALGTHCFNDLTLLVVNAQDSFRLTRRQADRLFLQNNLFLLAEWFHIDASQAQLIQTRLLDNPTVSVELSSFNNQTRRVLDVGRAGEKIISVQQLLYTADRQLVKESLCKAAVNLRFPCPHSQPSPTGPGAFI